MAMLFQTGFEGTGGDSTSESLKWGAALFSVQTTNARSGTYSGTFQGSMGTFQSIADQSGVVVGVSWRFASSALPAANGEDSLIFFNENATTHIALYLATNAGGVTFLRIKRGATTLATDTVKVINHSSQIYFELKANIHDSTGTYEVQVDGVQVAALTASGQDTQNGGTGVINRVYFNSPGGVVSHADDVYIAGTSGGAVTSFLSTSTRTFRVKGVIASSGNGSNTDFTPSTGGDHGALVDETTPNGDTDYNQSGTVNHIDTYNYAALALPAGAVIKCVQVDTYAKKADAGARGFKTAAYVNSTTYTPNSEFSPTTTYDMFCDPFETNPDTAAAWTEGGVDGAEFGAKVTT